MAVGVGGEQFFFDQRMLRIARTIEKRRHLPRSLLQTEDKKSPKKMKLSVKFHFQISLLRLWKGDKNQGIESH